MKTPAQKLWHGLGAVFAGVRDYRRETGRSLMFWLVLLLFNFATQIVFRRHLAPGEFAMFNVLLALVGLFVLPVEALRHALDHFVPRAPDPARQAALQEARLPLLQTAALIWAFVGTLLLLVVLELMRFPRHSLVYFALPGVMLAMGATAGGAMRRAQNRLRLWGFFLLAAALLRLIFGAVFTGPQPWAEMALAAGWAGAFLLQQPLVRAKSFRLRWKEALSPRRDREFVRHALATFSVLLGVYLFINGDRIVAQVWFGRPQENNMGYVPWDLFDAYQTAGLLARALPWGLQPLLLFLLVRRLPLEHTSPALRNLFWAYLGFLALGVFLLHALAGPLVSLFSGSADPTTIRLLGAFAWLMVPVGLLQGFGLFALASRRYPECFTLGGASLVYVALLAAIGRPQLMLTYAFGGATMALMLVLIVGIVRWGRRQP